MSNLNELVWEQQFRPKKVADCILPEKTKEMIASFLKNDTMPNFLFSGVAGIGKTTLAYAIAHELDGDLLFVNASLEGNIDTLRTKITQFVSSVSFTNSKKIVVLDEADYLTSATQGGLRGFMDEFSSNCIFIFTCNFKSRIIDPLLSRLTVIDFKFTKEEKQAAGVAMLKRSCHILDSKGVSYDKKAVAGLVSKNFPDFRKTLVELQRYASSGAIDTGILSSFDDSGFTALIEAMKEKNFSKCRQWVTNASVDSSLFYRGLYDKLLPLLVPVTVPNLILTLADYQHKATASVDQEINQIACIVTIMSNTQFK